MSTLTVSPSPHIHTKKTTQKIMLDMIIALMPSVISATVLFGLNSLLIITVGVLSSVLSEFLFNLICRRPQTVYDLSAIVTGIILSLSLPSEVPLWQVMLGSVFAVIVVKCIFGGIGKNFANPVATARVMLLLSFSSTIGKYTNPVFLDVSTSATPLVLIKNGAYHKLPSVLQILFGIRGGCIGEGCIIAILIGFVYLLIKRIITLHAPLGYILTVALLSALLGRNPIYDVFSGSVFFAAVFMATDYSSTPINQRGRLIFGIGCGIITMLIRLYGIYPEGVSFSILFMNILTPYIERIGKRKPLGVIK